MVIGMGRELREVIPKSGDGCKLILPYGHGQPGDFRGRSWSGAQGTNQNSSRPTLSPNLEVKAHAAATEAKMKRLLPLTLALILVNCRAHITYQGDSYNLVPDCGPRGCGVTYFVNYVGYQDYTEFGFYEGKLFFRQVTFLTRE